MARIKTETLKKLAKRIASTRTQELDCDGCMELIEQFVEKELDGQDAARIIPLVRHHLDTCSGCEEEYEALLTALKAADPSLN